MIRRALFCAFLSSVMLFSEARAAGPVDFNRYFIEAARIAKPSVVNIVIYKKKEDGSSVQVAFGSGTIVSVDGTVITNFHVLAKGNHYRVISHKGTEYDLKMFRSGAQFLADVKTDIAVIRIDNFDKKIFVPVVFSDSGLLSEGEWVLAIGNPYGLNQSITGGIVSSKGRDNIGFSDIEDFIQTDVAINPGNSGGPLVNLNGKLVGINTAIRTLSGAYQGISFAIPANIVKQVCQELLKYGRVRRGWLGFVAREKSAGAGSHSIIEIVSVTKNSPADIAGLMKGDILKKLDGIPVSTLGGLIKAVGAKPVGSRLDIAVSRGGELFDFSLLLREKSEHHAIQKAMRELFTACGIEIDQNADSNSVVISYVSPRYVDTGLRRGDIIVSVNGSAVSTIGQFIAVFEASGGRIHTMKINRENIISTIELINERAGD